MSDIEISHHKELNADLAREQPSDHILSQLALATIMLALEVELLAFVRSLNAAEANAAPNEHALERPFARLRRRFAVMNIQLRWRSIIHQLQHSPA